MEKNIGLFSFEIYLRTVNSLIMKLRDLTMTTAMMTVTPMPPTVSSTTLLTSKWRKKTT